MNRKPACIQKSAPLRKLFFNYLNVNNVKLQYFAAVIWCNGTKDSLAIFLAPVKYNMFYCVTSVSAPGSHYLPPFYLGQLVC